MRLYLVRHGETIWNLESRFQGWADQPLSQRGVEQAGELKDRLATVRFDAAYSSTLRRASRTAGIIVEDRGLEVVALDDFREMGIGELDGLNEQQIRERFPGLLEGLRDDPADYVVPGGESLRQVQARAWAALEKLAARHQGETVLLVAHHSVNKSLICKMLSIPLHNFRILRQPPCAVSVLEFRDGRHFVHAVNLNWSERVSPWHDLADVVKDRIRNPRAVIFDMDGVLIDSIPYYAAAWRGALAEWGVFPQEIELFRHESEKAESSIEYFFKQAGLSADKRTIEEVKRRVWEIFERFPAIGLKPDIIELLKTLRKSGRRLALVTGSPRNDLERAFDDGLLGLFDAVVTGDDVDSGKPHPEPYLKALEKLNLRKDDAIAVENSPLGIKASKAAGITTLALTSTLPFEELAEADLVIDSLSRLLGWLEL